MASVSIRLGTRKETYGISRRGYVKKYMNENEGTVDRSSESRPSTVAGALVSSMSLDVSQAVNEYVN